MSYENKNKIPTKLTIIKPLPKRQEFIKVEANEWNTCIYGTSPSVGLLDIKMVYSPFYGFDEALSESETHSRTLVYVRSLLIYCGKDMIESTKCVLACYVTVFCYFKKRRKRYIAFLREKYCLCFCCTLFVGQWTPLLFFEVPRLILLQISTITYEYTRTFLALI